MSKNVISEGDYKVALLQLSQQQIVLGDDGSTQETDAVAFVCIILSIEVTASDTPIPSPI